MTNKKKNPISPLFIFLIGFLVLGGVFFVFPINLFDGMIILENGLQTIEKEVPLSLSYFVGMGLNEGDLLGVKDFYLLPKGIAMVGVIWIGIPALLAYRFYLKSK